MATSDQAFYDLRWRNYQPALDDGSPQAERLGRISVALERVVGERRNLTVLDLGCGTGWMAARLARFGRVTGVDFSAAAIASAQAAHPGGRFVARDVLTESLHDLTPFDVVVSSEVIEHVRDKQRFITVCSQVLAPGGYLILTTPNRAVWDRYWSSTRVDAASWRQPVEEWLGREEMPELLLGRFELIASDSFVLNFDDRGIYRLINSVKLNALARSLGIRRPVLRWCERAWLGLYTIYVARKI